ASSRRHTPCTIGPWRHSSSSNAASSRRATKRASRSASGTVLPPPVRRCRWWRTLCRLSRAIGPVLRGRVRQSRGAGGAASFTELAAKGEIHPRRRRGLTCRRAPLLVLLGGGLEDGHVDDGAHRHRRAGIPLYLDGADDLRVLAVELLGQLSKLLV